MRFYFLVNGLADFKVILKDDLRHYKVSKLVLHVAQNPLADVFNDFDLQFLIFGVLYELLDHTQTLLVNCKFVEVYHDHIKDVVLSLIHECLNNLLDHVLSLDIFGKATNVSILGECFLNYLVLFFFCDCPNNSLESPGSSIIT